MNLAEVLAVPVSLSANNSALCYQDIMRQGWRCYSPAHSSGGAEEVDRLIGRYLRAHASTPSMITRETLASQPIETFEFPWGKFVMHGVLFMNGAVVHVKVKGNTPYNILFIADLIAEKWGYPNDFIIIPPQ